MTISTQGLLDKCKRQIQGDLSGQGIDDVIKDAIMTADAEIDELDNKTPLAWNRETYDELFTKYTADISDVSAADPGVITADSRDADLTSDHGFASTDLVFVRGIVGTERLNERVYRFVKTAATTGTLNTMDGDDAISTASYEAYDSGGTIYHAGFILPKTTIQPTNSWTINNVWGMEIDGYPVWPISESEVLNDPRWQQPGSRPTRYRYQKYAYGAFNSGTTDNSEHLLFLYNLPVQRYVCKLYIEKKYPDISTWNTTTFSHHPPEIHDYIWQMALADLAIFSEKARRKTIKGDLVGDNTKIEVMNAAYWINKRFVIVDKILAHSRKLAGYNRSTRGMSA